MTAGLNELSTYGLLKDMAADELHIYIEALIAAGCLKVKGGAYPTISTTELGDRVMREQERVDLALR
jgi:superfamily II DNA helicase RecQ